MRSRGVSLDTACHRQIGEQPNGLTTPERLLTTPAPGSASAPAWGCVYYEAKNFKFAKPEEREMPQSSFWVSAIDLTLRGWITPRVL